MGVEEYEVIIVGGGALGLSAAYHCTKHFEKILVLEQFPFSNQRGSSADFVRMFRVMYSEEFLAQLALETMPMWDALENRLGLTLIDKTGLLNFGVNTPYTPEGSLDTTMSVMDKLRIPYRKLSSEELHREYPFRNLPKNYYGLFQKDGGTINVPGILQGLYALSEQAGVKLQRFERVVDIDPRGGIQVVTNRTLTNTKHTYKTSKLILCPGAYANQVLKSLGIQLSLEIWEMTFAYYQMHDPLAKYPMWFQFEFPLASGEARLFYGYPSEPWAHPGYLRLAVDYASHVMTAPEQRTFVPAVEDIHLTMNYIQEHLKGVDTEPTHMATCMVPLIPVDNGFVLDFAPARVPSHKDILICTAGWAFKFTPMFGLILSHLAAGIRPERDLTSMSINRAGVLADSPPAPVRRLRRGHPALTA